MPLKAPLDAFIVHLDWIYHSYEERKRKVERYRAIDPELGFADRYLYEDNVGGESDFAPVWEEEFREISQTKLKKYLPGS